MIRGPKRSTALDGNPEHPPVSVVIPTYNRADLLPACIDSALRQDYPSFEVLVVDDGSSDNTQDVCRAYGGTIRYIRKRNGGTASALNVGLGAMSGLWFKWLSSDDMFEKGGLSKLMATAVGTTADIVYGDLMEIDSRGRYRGERKQRSFSDYNDLVVELWRHFIGSACGSVMRRSAFDRVGAFDESLGYAEDYEWWLRGALIHGVGFRHVSSVVGLYRVHPGQISQERKDAALMKQQLIRARVRAQVRSAASSDPRLLEYHKSLTVKLRKTYAPIIPFVLKGERLPKGLTAAYFLSRILPRIASEVYWAARPPLEA